MTDDDLDRWETMARTAGFGTTAPWRDGVLALCAEVRRLRAENEKLREAEAILHSVMGAEVVSFADDEDYRKLYPGES